MLHGAEDVEGFVGGGEGAGSGAGTLRVGVGRGGCAAVRGDQAVYAEAVPGANISRFVLR